MFTSEAKKQLIATLEESARHEAKEKLLEIVQNKKLRIKLWLSLA